MWFQVVLPLRTTTSTVENAVWQLPPRIRHDDAALERLQDLRRTIVDACSQQDNSMTQEDRLEVAVSLYETFQDYAAALEECEQAGVTTTSRGDGFAWSSNDDDSESVASVRWERCNVVWNMIAMASYQASCAAQSALLPNEPPSKRKAAWAKAGVEWQKAAALARYLQTLLASSSNGDTTNYRSVQLRADFCQLWELYLTATAQRAALEAFQCLGGGKPRHFMLAKLATAANILYGQVEQKVLSAPWTPPRQWEDSIRAWGMYLSAMAEYHQSCAHADKKELGPSLVRLRAGVRYIQLCHDFVQDTTAGSSSRNGGSGESQDGSLDGLVEKLNESLPEILTRCQQTEERCAGKRLPAMEDLPEISPQRTVNVEQTLPKVIPKAKQPLFQPSSSAAPPPSATNKAAAVEQRPSQDATAKRMAESFAAELDKLLQQTSTLSEETTERGRAALAAVDLPHSLQAYRQARAASGDGSGGIPLDLWERVHTLQRQDQLVHLKQELWDLRDCAETAQTTYKTIERQLDEDVEMDGLFRQQHRGYDGHDVSDIQKTFRHSLENYNHLLGTAQDGDSVLFQRLEILDTDPKYKLLQFQKAQLDRLLPPGQGGAQQNAEIDVSVLSRLLGDLSALFAEREKLVKSFEQQAQSYDAVADLGKVSPTSSDVERQYRRILDGARETFGKQASEIHANVEAQGELVHQIIQENEAFVRARDSRPAAATSSDSCVVMMEDALEEIEQLTKHLKEGRDFYRVILPKLDKLRQQVLDVSARLTVERCEFEDRQRRQQQETEDARIAASFGQSGSSNGGSPGRQDAGLSNGAAAVSHASQQESSGQSQNVEPQPGVEAVSHDTPVVRVDDEKVASLVAMEFSPEAVVAALQKYDNNFDQALNDLLSG